MHRRQFLRALAVGSAAFGGPSACNATSATIVNTTLSSSPNSIALAAKRYDERSGSGVFSGTVPLRPGQLRESELGRVSLWEGPLERPLATIALSPRHPDGSIKVVAIHSILDLPSGRTKVLTLVLDRPPTMQPPAPATIDIAWMRAPRLIACTDPYHLCASRIAPWPLVPVTHPQLPDWWKKFLTTEFEMVDHRFPTWGNWRRDLMADRPISTFGNAFPAGIYDALACVYISYLTSGSIDRLREAHHLAVYESSGQGSYWGGYPFGTSYFLIDTALPYWEQNGGKMLVYGADYNGHPANSDVVTNISGWRKPPNQGPVATAGGTGTAEWNSGFHHDMWFCWVLSGWEQALLVLLPYAVRGLPNNLTPSQWATMSPPPADGYGGRFTFRREHEPGLYVPLINHPAYLKGTNWNTTHAVPYASHKSAYLRYMRRFNFDAYDAWSKAFTQGGGGYHWRYGIWGYSPTFSTQDNPPWYPASTYRGGYPNFDNFMVFMPLLMQYLNFDPDPRFGPAMMAYAVSMFNQIRGPQYCPFIGQHIYGAPYGNLDGGTQYPNFVAADGTLIACPADGGTGGVVAPDPVSAMTALLMWAYRYSGNAAFKTVAEAHATARASLQNGYLPPGLLHSLANSGQNNVTWKEFGMIYLNAFIAAAYAAGVPWDGWDVPGTANAWRRPRLA